MPLRHDINKLSGLGSASEVNLIAFLLDGSPSMTGTKTEDGRTKAAHLVDIVGAVLQRLRGSAAASSLRASLVYFNSNISIIEKDGNTHLTLDEAIKELEDPVEHIERINPNGGTAIADALKETREIIIPNYMHREDLPDKKYMTVFLFTDGQENIRSRDDVVAEALSIKQSSAKLATISFGIDADQELLISIASELDEAQKNQLQYSGVIRYLPQPSKMFIDGQVNDKITEEKAQAIRQFIDVLSRTYKDDDDNNTAD